MHSETILQFTDLWNSDLQTSDSNYNYDNLHSSQDRAVCYVALVVLPFSMQVIIAVEKSKKSIYRILNYYKALQWSKMCAVILISMSAPQDLVYYR